MGANRFPSGLLRLDFATRRTRRLTNSRETGLSAKKWQPLDGPDQRLLDGCQCGPELTAAFTLRRLHRTATETRPLFWWIAKAGMNAMFEVATPDVRIVGVGGA